MIKISWKQLLGATLVTLCLGFYALHYFIFKDLHHIILYFIGDLAFLWFDVFIVLLLLEGLLSSREKQSIQKKLNMVIGTFYSEMGTELLKICARSDKETEKLIPRLMVNKDWTDKHINQAISGLSGHKCFIDCKRIDLDKIRSFLISKRPFLLSLLENPNLLEYESFTNLLWAVFHFTDELASRDELKSLPDADYKHLAGDMDRVYKQLLKQWLSYMNHLRKDYPYLFSLAVRKNPFNSNASVIIKE